MIANASKSRNLRIWWLEMVEWRDKRNHDCPNHFFYFNFYI